MEKSLDNKMYKVVINHEEQYSIWPLERENPAGWTQAPKSGSKEECLAYIEEVWVDMRPLSLRRKMEAAAAVPLVIPEEVPSGPTLIERLSQGEHCVEISLRPEKSAAKFKEKIDSGFVHVKFYETKGGTELGVRLDLRECDLLGANFASQTGKVKLVGKLTLDFQPVRCHATVDLETFRGSGKLEAV